MHSDFTNKKRAYFKYITRDIQKQGIQFIIIAHVVSDALDLLSALNEIGHIALIIAVPYSCDATILNNLQKSYKILTPSLPELLNPNYLIGSTTENINCAKRTIVIEVGGYYAPAIHELHAALNGKLLGIIEDTEAGHKRYKNVCGSLPCPILSVARSELKKAEDTLIGYSCLHATETLLRKAEFPFNDHVSLVLGYGKIGRGLARALKKKASTILVYDTNPIKRTRAFSEGFLIPDKTVALQQAEIIYGASGEQSITKHDIKHIKDGAILVSCSSKQIEFDVEFIKENFKRVNTHNYMDKYINETNHLYIAGDGQPINFVDDKILVGPVILLIQAEILCAIKYLLSKETTKTLQQVGQKDKEMIAKHWIDNFFNPGTGRFMYV